MAEKNKPVKTYNYRGVNLSVFENKITKDGEERKINTYVVSRMYKDAKTEEIKFTNQFNELDLLKLKEVLDRATKDIVISK